MDFSKLMPPARWRLLCMALMVLAVVLLVLSSMFNVKVYEQGAMVAVVLVVLGIALFWRCPRCKSRLPLHDMMHLDRCPHCHADIRGFNEH